MCGDDEKCGRVLFNRQPIEADAHAASSTYLRRRYSDAVPALLAGEDRFLAASTEPPGATEQLVHRTVEFLRRFAEACNDPANLPDGTTFADILDQRLLGSGDHWRWLESAD